MKKRAISLLMAGILMGAMTSPVFATEETQLQDNNIDQDKQGSTAVEGTVSHQEPDAPSYVITIPSKIDFGTLYQPAVDQDANKDIKFTVAASDFTNMRDGSGVVVWVRDSNDVQTYGEWSGTFAIKNHYGNKLNYTLLNAQGEDLTDLKRDYEQGMVFNVFATEGGAQGTARLNQRQLVNVDLDQWAGVYTGTVQFYSKIRELQDFI